VDLSFESKPLGHKRIFKKKMRAYGTINKYKEKPIVKGFKQQ
jgi:hypothetical protein